MKSVCQKVSDNQPSLVAGVADATRFYWEPVARHTYNGIGELTKKTLGCGIQNIEYQYQMRGWLTQLNDPADLNKGFAPADKHFFGMKLAYDGVGNITTWDYRNAQTSYGPPYDLIQQAPYQYGFTYDKLNRLTSGTLAQQGQTKFTLGNLSYDENGNIQTMTRSMNNASDVMGYTYGSNSNKLTSLSSSQGLNLAKSTTYSYDQAGNLLTDQTKGITSIGYNYLNLPATITKGGQPITYTYSASGQKLKADFGGGKTYDYIAGLVYDQAGLEFIPTAEGRVLPPGRASTTVTTGSSTSVIASNRFYRYEYHLKDHLGNLRVACRCGERQTETSPGDSYEPLVVQEQHYDPFGLNLTSLNSQMGMIANRTKYNGKEEQQSLGWIDYGARMYDPAIGRWNGIDPLAEKYLSLSTNVFSGNNPLIYRDTDGRQIIISVRTGGDDSKEEELRYRDGKLYTKDGKLYTGKDEFALTVQKTLSKIENSKDKFVRKVFEVLENSKNAHIISHKYKNDSGSEMPFISENSKPTGSNIGFTGVQKNLENGKLKATLETTLGHELRHSYDYDQGKMAGEFGKQSSSSDPAEIRAVNFENRIRKYDVGLPLRRTYNGVFIDNSKLEDPKKDPKDL